MQPHSVQQRHRFETLDALRGLAALGVVVWHWQHMLLVNLDKTTWPPHAFSREVEPFYPLLKVFYEQGHRAVDLFFVVSGFVFFYLYETAIRRGEVGAREFFVLRFSRLYPLFFATLIAIAIMQAGFFALKGQWFVYNGNDAAHFLPNLLMINSPPMSFNGPTWTITMELGAYAVFFVLARMKLLGGWIGPAVVFACGLWLWNNANLIRVGSFELRGNALWGMGLAGFFAGGLTYRVFALLTREAVSSLMRKTVTVAAVTAWIWLVGTLYLGVPKDIWTWLTPREAPLLPVWLVCYGLFPLTTLACALWATQGRARAVCDWIGSTSYSSYLLHFPMQLGLALIMLSTGLFRDAFSSVPVFVMFFCLLMLASRLVYVGFEAPAQRWLRGKLLPLAKHRLPYQRRPAVAPVMAE